MVSFHKALVESPTTAVPVEFEASSKKRKWEEPFGDECFKDQAESEKRKSIFDVELNLKTPLPSDKWQQYLSIQSGQTHFCNTRINMKTPDPEDPPSPAQMSLDLELNLTCESLRKKAVNYDINEKQNYSSPGSLSDHDLCSESSKYKKDPGELSFEGDHREMVATVCMRCHMLVMLCKSSPACPNCKFMHPPDQNPSTFLKRKCSLLC